MDYIVKPTATLGDFVALEKLGATPIEGCSGYVRVRCENSIDPLPEYMMEDALITVEVTPEILDEAGEVATPAETVTLGGFV